MDAEVHKVAAAWLDRVVSGDTQAIIEGIRQTRGAPKQAVAVTVDSSEQDAARALRIAQELAALSAAAESPLMVEAAPTD